MKCICWEKYYSKVVFSLEHAKGDLPFIFRDYNKFQGTIYQMIEDIEKNWRCVEECWKLLGESVTDEDGEKKIV